MRPKISRALSKNDMYHAMSKNDHHEKQIQIFSGLSELTCPHIPSDQVPLLFLNILLWMIVVFVFYFISYFIPLISTGIYITLLIQSCSQVGAYIMLAILGKHLNVKVILFGAFFIFGSVSVIYQFSGNFVGNVIVVVLMTFSIAIA